MSSNNDKWLFMNSWNIIHILCQSYIHRQCLFLFTFQEIFIGYSHFTVWAKSGSEKKSTIHTLVLYYYILILNNSNSYPYGLLIT